MITSSSFWKCLSLVVGVMAVPGEAQESPSYSVTFQPPSLTLDSNGLLSYNSSGKGVVSGISIILLQYNAPDLVKLLDVETNLTFRAGYPGIIQSGALTPRIHGRQSPVGYPGQTIPVYLTGTNGSPPNSTALQNLLFCAGSVSDSKNVCGYYSDVFDASPGDNIMGAAAPTSVAERAIGHIFSQVSTIISTLTSPQITILTKTAVPTPSTTTASSGSISLVTISTSLATLTEVPTATTSPTAAAVSSKHTKSGLSTGAKVGIALGALALVFILLLLALFFLRRKHSKRASKRNSSPPEQVLLTRDMHTDSFTRNQIMLEKERNGSSTITPHDGLDTPLGGSSPAVNVIPAQSQRRHSALSPYEPIPSAPYNGPISPRRKPAPASPPTRAIATLPSTPNSPTSSHTRDSVTEHPPPHALSSSPHPSPAPSRSNSNSNSATTPASAFETYHDIPIFGDARHVPQVFSHGREGERGVESPFLREEIEGMSADEVARLEEEEERRIDAAIAAAEAGRS